MLHQTLILSALGTIAAIKRSSGAQQHLLAATDSLLDAIEKTEDAIDDQMLAVVESSLNSDRPAPIDFAQHMSSLLGQPMAPVAVSESSVDPQSNLRGPSVRTPDSESAWMSPTSSSSSGCSSSESLWASLPWPIARRLSLVWSLSHLARSRGSFT
ncbi:hypothetical protein FOZ60_003373 [Perkinsus olseni]|uniref:Uncharacterized protein n=1 Tax=Perkinsus olseni TaxID=32597 RepID=A0A7J6PIL1_PEROL|nr:hypothetical protein FOZ60_003373 [Perkinsus olseni]